MGDHPDFYIPYSEGTITEQTAAYCKHWNFYQSIAIAAATYQEVYFTITDTYHIHIPVSITVSPLANTWFRVQVWFDTLGGHYGWHQAICEAHFSGITGLQLVNGDIITVRVYNGDTSQRTFEISASGVKILKPMGY
jgi:hypothetical protein